MPNRIAALGAVFLCLIAVTACEWTDGIADRLAPADTPAQRVYRLGALWAVAAEWSADYAEADDARPSVAAAAVSALRGAHGPVVEAMGHARAGAADAALAPMTVAAAELAAFAEVLADPAATARPPLRGDGTAGAVVAVVDRVASGLARYGYARARMLPWATRLEAMTAAGRDPGAAEWEALADRVAAARARLP